MTSRAGMAATGWKRSTTGRLSRVVFPECAHTPSDRGRRS